PTPSPLFPHPPTSPPRFLEPPFPPSPLTYFLLFPLAPGPSLLLQPALSVPQITEETGFSQASYFSKCFKQKFGMSPKNYRQQYWKPTH
ncbi:helix-turn-helix domain-containing protein, partial [Paenibacillus sp. 28ISP30-2]|nr:helix-turn-helix domain-containing protein [Paenibacillus sp. 28ISP30-2]